MNCPSRRTLEHFLIHAEETLAQSPGLAEHLDNCERCQSILSGLARLQDRSYSLHLLSGSSPLLGQTFGQDPNCYRLEECIGSSSVYRARRLSDGLQVAVKLFQRINARQFQRVSLELQIASTLSHPHIVKLLDSGNQDGIQYAVFEWIGDNLAQSISTGVLPIGDAIQTVQQVAEAVELLHELGFIHRDLKPQNILIDDAGTAKLADFGAAKDLQDEDLYLTTTGGVVGTPSYMAPEQTGLIAASINERTDVYGLGSLLYSLLTGQPPFKGDTYQKVLQQVVSKMPTPVRKLRSEVPIQLQTICDKCMRKIPAERYASAREVREDLTRYLTGQKIEAEPIPWHKRLKAWSEDHYKTIGACSTICLIILGVFLVQIWQDRRERTFLEAARVDAILTQLLDATPSRMSELYRQTDDLPLAKVHHWISEHAASHANEARLLIRLFATCPETCPIQPKCEDWIMLSAECSLDEFTGLTRQLSDKKWTFPDSWRTRLVDSAIAAPLGVQFCNLCVALSLDNELPEPLCEKLMDSVADLEAKSLEAATDAFSGSSRKLTGVWSKIGTERQLRSSVLNTLVRWNSSDSRSLLQLIELHEPQDLHWLSSLKEDTKERLRTAIRNRLTQLSVLDGEALRPDAVAQKLARFADEHHGALFRSSGYVPNLSRAEVNQLIQVANQLGWSIRSIQTNNRNGRDEVACVVTPEPAQNSIVWGVPYDEVFERCEALKLQDYFPISFWLRPSTEEHVVDVVFAKGLLRSGNFTKVLKEPRTDLMSVDNDSTLTEIQFQAYPHDTKLPEKVLSLITQRPIKTRDESTRWVSVLVDSARVDAQTHYHESHRYVEQVGDCDSWVTVVANSLDEHNDLARLMASQNFTIQALRSDLRQGNYTSQWVSSPEFRKPPRLTPRLLMAEWELQKPDLVLNALNASTDPSVRTELTLALAKDANNAARIVHHLAADKLNVDQIQQLLLVLGMTNWSSLAPGVRDDVFALLNRFESHADSGIHFSAEWALRQVSGLPVQIIPKPKEEQEEVDLTTISHRGWFTDRNGIPFIVMRLNTACLTGTEPDIPWHPTMNQTVSVHQVDFAISAIEIPNSLFAEFLVENPKADLSSSRVYPVLPNAPVTSSNLISYLKFCRWLSDREGISNERNCLPSLEHIDYSMVAPDDFLKRDGYRLPTHLEWELAARAGCWTPTYWGRRIELSERFAWTAQNTQFRNLPMGLKPPNPWGLFDVLGNVYEICFSKDYFFPGPKVKLTEKTEVGLFGGSFLANSRYASTDWLNAITANSFDTNAGIRIVRRLQPLKQ